MKMRWRGGFVTAGLATLLQGAGGTVEAGDLIRCRIPFGFSVAEKELPAGDYSVERIGGVVFVRGHRGGALAMTHASEADPTAEGKLAFQRIGGDYVLIQLWLGGPLRYDLEPSHATRERLRAAPGGGAEVARVVVPAS